MAKRMPDPKLPDSSVRITDFGGMSPGTDQHDNNPGLSWFQVNCVPYHPGELRCRQGFQIVRFEGPPDDYQEDVPTPVVRFAEAKSKLFLGGTAASPGNIPVDAFTDLMMSAQARIGTGKTGIAGSFLSFGSSATATLPVVINANASSTIVASSSARAPSDIEVSASSVIVAKASGYGTTGTTALGFGLMGMI